MRLRRATDLAIRALGSIDLPDDAAPTWMVASPDGAVLVTGAEHGFQLSKVVLDRARSAVAHDPAEHPALELARLAGPIVDASTLPPEEIVVLARPVPAHLREIADATWDVRDDVDRYLGVERPPVRGQTRRRRPRR